MQNLATFQSYWNEKCIRQLYHAMTLAIPAHGWLMQDQLPKCEVATTTWMLQFLVPPTKVMPGTLQLHLNNWKAVVAGGDIIIDNIWWRGCTCGKKPCTDSHECGILFVNAVQNYPPPPILLIFLTARGEIFSHVVWVCEVLSSEADLIGRDLQCSLILVCVSLHRWVNAIGQTEAPPWLVGHL